MKGESRYSIVIRVALSVLILVSILLVSSCQINGQIGSPVPPTGTAVPPTATPTAPPAANQPQQPTPTVSAPSAQLPSISDVADAVRPAVVSVVVQSVAADFFLQPSPQEGAGSGVIFDKQGFILTNNHVVEGARKITVNLTDKRTFDAELVGRDPATDLAVIKVPGDNLPTAPLGDSSKLRIGEWVVAIGNALGLPGGPTVTVGVVSAVDRSISSDSGTLHGLVQTDAAINPGNSGGPLINLKGEVVGVNTAIIAGAEGIGFAIGISNAKPIVEDLMTKGYVVRIGIAGVAVTPAVAKEFNLASQEGILVARVERGSPAATAGLQASDVITNLAGNKVTTAEELLSALRKYKAGDKVEVTFERQQKEQTATLTLVKPLT